MLDKKWRKSSFSGGGNDCVEVNLNESMTVGIRDTKERTLSQLTVNVDAWRSLLKRAAA